MPKRRKILFNNATNKMETSDITGIIGSFVDEHYPKGDDNRGFALTVLAMFLLELNGENSKYKLVEDTDK